MFYGKIHDFNGNFPVRYVCLPEGTTAAGEAKESLKSARLAEKTAAAERPDIASPWLETIGQQYSTILFWYGYGEREREKKKLKYTDYTY